MQVHGLLCSSLRSHVMPFPPYSACGCCSVTKSCPTLSGLQPARLLCPWDSPRQEYWSGFPFPSPGDLLDPGIEPRSPASQADSLPSEPLGKPHCVCWDSHKGSLMFKARRHVTVLLVGDWQGSIRACGRGGLWQLSSENSICQKCLYSSSLHPSHTGGYRIQKPQIGSVN